MERGGRPHGPRCCGNGLGRPGAGEALPSRGGGLGTSGLDTWPAREAVPQHRAPTWAVSTGATTFPRGPREPEGAGCGRGAPGCRRHQGCWVWGSPEGGPEGACVTLPDTAMPPKAAKTFGESLGGGTVGQAWLAPSLPQRVHRESAHGAGDASPLLGHQAGGGARERGRPWTLPHLHPGLTLLLGQTWDSEERTLPHGGLEAGLSPPSPRGAGEPQSGPAPPGDAASGRAGTSPALTPAPGLWWGQGEDGLDRAPPEGLGRWDPRPPPRSGSHYW